jgi:uncharacterized protein (TIGR02145 family)
MYYQDCKNSSGCSKLQRNGEKNHFKKPGVSEKPTSKGKFYIVHLLLATTMIFAGCDKDDADKKPTSDTGMVINGVKWATRNVDAPGAFAAAPESFGMIYQWNRKVGWSATGQTVNSNGGIVWDDHNSIDSKWKDSSEWNAENDPSPNGWRLPTSDEIDKLLDTEKVSNEWTAENGINGIRFTDKVSGNSIFLPAAGFRDNNGYGPNAVASRRGNYWSSTYYQTSDGYAEAYFIYFDNAEVANSTKSLDEGRTIRCVAK